MIIHEVESRYMSEEKQTREVVIRGAGGSEVSRDEKKEVSEGGMSQVAKAFIALEVIIGIFMLIIMLGLGP